MLNYINLNGDATIIDTVISLQGISKHTPNRRFINTYLISLGSLILKIV